VDALFEAAFAWAPTGIAVTDVERRIIRANATFCEMVGRDESEILGTTTDWFTHPEDRAATAALYRDVRGDAGTRAIEKRFLCPDGGTVWASARVSLVMDADGQPSHYIAHVVDVTALKQAELRQAEATRLFETAFAEAPIGIALVGLDGQALRVNHALCRLLGYSEQDFLDKGIADITHPDDLDADLREVERLLASEVQRYSMQKRYITGDGREVWANLSVSLVRDDDGTPIHFISQIEDISERKALEASLRHLADHDSLTELYNRRRFEEELERQIARCRRSGEHAALLMIDLDGFKAVNDAHGHGVGDELLRRIAGELRTRLRMTDCIARIGGDEFAIILPHVSVPEAEHVRAVIEEMIEAIGVEVVDGSTAVGASVGIERLDAETAGVSEALASADAAMYAAKAGDDQ
jgi:diguanylate cyclase (GGDEF)-like protein/PAS domain S-box-containing protein